MSKEINTIVALCDFNIINTVCKDIADNKTGIEVSELLIEELSELIKAVIKLERWDNGDFYTFTESNMLERVKQMKVERFDIVSEKLIVIKVVGVINE